jgi:hypothetical protein
MRSLPKLLLACVGAIAIYSAQACTAGVPEADLNPQPLPPGPGTGEPARDPNSSDETDKNGGAMGGTGASPTPASDAGTEGGDAADGGDR